MSGMTVQQELVVELRKLASFSKIPIQEFMEMPIDKLGGESWADALMTRDEEWLRREVAQMRDAMP